MAARQHTIKTPVSVEGIGIHTGCKSKVVLKPAPAGTGIKFRRIDIKGSPEVPAHIDYVTDVNRGTTVENGPAKVQTIEHLLAAAAGLEIDNLTVDINAEELPVGDGSSAIFTEALQEAGIKQQDKEREYYKPSEALSIKTGETEIMVFPADELFIGLTLHYDSSNIVGTQFKDILINPKNYINNISAARTYCFEEEIDRLKEMGLGLGGNMENTVVVGKTGIKNTELRFKDEFVRHKILDLIGDLYLLGRPLKARVSAIRCGHAANIEITRKLREQMLSNSGERKTGSLNIYEIMDILPHRYPFLLIDRIEIKEKNKSTGYKNITIDEPFFKGHYPGRPVFPRSLIIEFIAQSSAVMLLSGPEVKNKLAYFIIIQNARFWDEIKPPDVLRAEVELVRARERGGKVKGEAFVGEKKVASAEFMFSLVDK